MQSLILPRFILSSILIALLTTPALEAQQDGKAPLLRGSLVEDRAARKLIGEQAL